MKQIFVLRHAHTERGSVDHTDHSRILTFNGIEECKETAKKLMNHKVDAVLCSTATRAQQTFENLRLHCPSLPPAMFLDKLYLASPGDITPIIQAIEDSTECVLIVGHNPGLQEFCMLFAAHSHEKIVQNLIMGLETCGLIEIQLSAESWRELKPGGGKITSYSKP